MIFDTAPLRGGWGERRRRIICGFNVASDCVGGLALLIGIPALVGVHLAAVVLAPSSAASHDDSSPLLEVLVELLLCLGSVIFLFLLLVTNPGFVEMPTDLSCRCRRCGIEVEDFDHHCGAVGACIGKDNMCYFILFLLFTAMLCVLGAVQNVAFVAAAMRARSDYTGPSWAFRKACIDTVLTALRSPRALCLLVLSAVAVIGGAVCTFLCLRYTFLAYQGRSSRRRRRQVGAPGSLSAVFSKALHPTFSHNFHFPWDYTFEPVSV
ncbi:hypothetical protein JIQ42_01769 [Leishmania sp. Namibia]|uniref:hypothetical protein n=1 Tax=Leishmania sp. Namibia TaxID=2802991 RepID=UPI001B4E8227|nr:hypothetical protein JIQ42_01769 [Leishmania sp. Namibia]